jgi:hypothetical protein
MVCHGFYARTVEDLGQGFVIRVRRYFCAACRRTVSLLPEFVLPYLRFTILTMGLFLKARLLWRLTLKAAAETARQAGMPYQRGQQWVDRFRRQAEGLSASLTALVRPIEGPDFIARAIGMLDKAGWIEAHRFLFAVLRVHLLGWPHFLAPAGIPVTMGNTVWERVGCPQSTCMDSESSPA